MGRRKSPSYIVRPDTALLTEGFDPRLSVGSARPAVFRSSTYVFSSPEAAERAFAIALGRIQPTESESVELIYSRLSHPNAEILEDHLVPLEPGARGAAVFNTGMAAISTVLLTACRPGSSVVYTAPIYGGTYHLLHQVLQPYSIHTISVPAGDTSGLARAIAEAEHLRVVLIETPANPTLRMTDIAAAVEAARRREEPPIVAVDNTFLGPVFQHPLQLGADLVIYSGTKFLAGFSDMLAGVVLGRDLHLLAEVRGARAILGTILQPDECWLLETRLATLALRMNKQSKNAKRIVDALANHPKIERVHYPTLFEEAEQRRIFTAQCRFPGSMFSLVLKGGKMAAFELLRRLRIVKNAVSLGGMESLACHPATTTHSEMPPDELKRFGIGDGLVRVSVGVEDWRDLLRDFQEALGAV